MFTEASEEGLTTIANTMTDCIINGNMSSIALEYQGYIDEGYTKEEATAKCAENFGKQVLLDAAGGAVSGGVLGGTVSGISYAKGKINSNIDMKRVRKRLAKRLCQMRTLTLICFWNKQKTAVVKRLSVLQNQLKRR